MINFEKLPDGNIRANSEEYVLIATRYKRLIDIDGSFTLEEFEQILETAKAVSLREQPQSTVAASAIFPGFVSLG